MSRLLLLALGVYALYVLVRALRRLEPERRRHSIAWTAGVLILAALILVLGRFGLQWLGVVGAVLLGVLKVVVPLALRLLPFLHHLRPKPRDSESSSDSGSASDAGSDARGTRMTRKEALEVLGIREGASRAEILTAYRNLIRKVHPDSPGGSTYLATKLNQARDVLLG